MILIDFSQMMIASYIAKSNFGTVDLPLFRHMALNKIRMYNVMFGAEYGDIILCCDSTNYWRTDKFKYYKFKRKSERKASKIDWDVLWGNLNCIKEELKDNMPYRVLEIKTAEADDIIASLCQEYGDCQKILIVSSDKDFAQLQTGIFVKQYDPLIKQIKAVIDPVDFLKEHILVGDKGDGIPNFLSDDDTLANVDKQQVRLLKSKLAKWKSMKPEEFCNKEQLKNYKRNESLVDLSKIPTKIKKKILNQYNNYKVKKGNIILDYFELHNLEKMIERIEEF